MTRSPADAASESSGRRDSRRGACRGPRGHRPPPLARELVALAVALGLGACAPRAVVRPDTALRRGDAPPADETVPAAAKAPSLEDVLAAARSHVGARQVRVNGRVFRYDCSGFVTGVYSLLGLDLMSLGAEYPGENGAALVHRFTERFGENHARKVPVPGELVYFDNTYDRNRNGIVDDALTHVGLVEAVDEDGTVWVIHRSNHGIVREPMNLHRPAERTDDAGKVINAWLRARSARDPPGTARLMGELFAGFGSVRPPPQIAWHGEPPSARGPPAAAE